MTTAENKAIQGRIVEEFINKRNRAVVEELMAEDWVGLDPSSGQKRRREDFIANVARLRAAFPDMEWTIKAEVGEGDRVACYIVWRGTHQGEFLGIPPTGKRVEVAAMAFDSFAAGQCKESVLLMDTTGLMQQLGALPSPGQTR